MPIYQLLLMILLAVVGSQLTNLIAIHWVDPTAPALSALRVSIFVIPITTFCTFIYNLYFSQGHGSLNYFTLMLISLAANLWIGAMFQALVVKGVGWSPYEMLGGVFLTVGIGFLLFDQQSKLG